MMDYHATFERALRKPMRAARQARSVVTFTWRNPDGTPGELTVPWSIYDSTLAALKRGGATAIAFTWREC